MNSNERQSDWLEDLAKDILAVHPEGEIVVSSGHSPSGVYHIGTLREIITANALTFELKRQGRKARHIDFVDDYDAFRKVPANVPEKWGEFIGRPLVLVPDPFDCHQSYGAHYLSDLHDALTEIGSRPDETVYGSDNYRQGVMTDQIEISLNHLPEIKAIIEEVSGRSLDQNWAPVQILSNDNNLRQWKYTGWDEATKSVCYIDQVGEKGTVGLDDGRVKLDWRLDWPARWAKFGVTVEPFGRDHATKGGSYDTGRVIVDQVFGSRAPFPVPYEFINTVGETKKMSKSTGNVMTPQQALEVMPPEILRFFIVGSKPSKTLNFDSGLGLYQLIDSYTRAGRAPSSGIEYAHANRKEETIADIPFNHLVSVYQAASEDDQATQEILERTGYSQEVEQSWPVIRRELEFVSNWLDKYAPESVIFRVQKELPTVELSSKQQDFLNSLSVAIEKNKLDGQQMHETIYALVGETGLNPAQAFQALYRIILGKDSGPKAGWFLASLDRKWLARRLRGEG